mgnify:FL=1
METTIMTQLIQEAPALAAMIIIIYLFNTAMNKRDIIYSTAMAAILEKINLIGSEQVRHGDENTRAIDDMKKQVKKTKKV